MPSVTTQMQDVQQQRPHSRVRRPSRAARRAPAPVDDGLIDVENLPEMSLAEWEQIPTPYRMHKLRHFAGYFSHPTTADCYLWVYPPTSPSTGTSLPTTQHGDPYSASHAKRSQSQQGSYFPEPIAVLPGHIIVLASLSPMIRNLVAKRPPADPCNPTGPLSIIVQPPSPEGFIALLRWMYTACIPDMVDFLDTYDDAVPAIIVNAQWLELEDRELELLCMGFLDEERRQREGGPPQLDFFKQDDDEDTCPASESSNTTGSSSHK
ncbi:hypothetical protein HDU85_002084 [Gaertneriomyces sp. JEL0708]|nr:hypothetical protein HDU85_002084 [Gaertneriomyces sp. JEL0708]